MLDRLRRWLQAQSQPDAHPRPTLVHDGDTLELRFARNVGQSRMACSDPDRLLIAYTRTMLAALVPATEAMPTRRLSPPAAAMGPMKGAKVAAMP